MFRWQENVREDGRQDGQGAGRKRGWRRRGFLIGAGGAVATALPGCVSAPSGGGVRFEALEVDDGPVFGPGLQSEIERAYFAALLTSRDGTDGFDLDGPGAEDATAFVRETDFGRELLGVVQVSGLNSSMFFEIAEVVRTSKNVVVVAGIRDDPPYSDDRVITTLLVRVPRASGEQPTKIWVELGFDGRSETISGSVVSGP